ncbi:uncharacterized protein TRAVEDRAFT_18277 [Trametes versicolor FP-101664 SS1]|uniref:uncharacterized protein n=1 Tax=Trametes versicolor (strain FP-101664) TaxID=717944 RepID=UPI0004622B78|nr:uncharacterized protein TRAVEDRAFT_18277 [Trametes versicolor FP-101664 SS1]EIW61624.1 hypothetical protein TRAVEDRAFT_18277 [Trametes versicolor FP-101664 SS1]
MQQMVENVEGAHLDQQLTESWQVSLTKFCQYVASVQDMPRRTTDKQYFGAGKLKLMIEAALSNVRCMDYLWIKTLQQVALWCLYLYTGCRPGSFLATRYYPTWYTRYQDVQVIRLEDGTFAVDLMVVAWKGRHGFEPWSINGPSRQTFRICSAHSESHYMLDLPMLVVVLHHQAFLDYMCLSDLIAGRDWVIHWRPEVTEMPFFVAGTARGYGTQEDRALPYNVHLTYFHRTCEQAGLGWEGNSPYLYRHATATTWTQILGADLTKAMMHHKQDMTTLFDHYANNAEQVDIVVAALYNEKRTVIGESSQFEPGLFRPTEMPETSVKLTLGDALAQCEELCLLYMQKISLCLYLSGEGDETQLEQVMNSLLPAEEAFIQQYNPGHSEDDDADDDFHCALLCHIQAYKQAKQPNLDDIAARNIKAITEAEDGTAEEDNEFQETVCVSGDGNKGSYLNGVMVSREQFMSHLINYEENIWHACPCPTLSIERRKTRTPQTKHCILRINIGHHLGSRSPGKSSLHIKAWLDITVFFLHWR